jgi:hypothetical protein
VIEELHGCMPLAASVCVRTVKLPVLPLARLTVPVKPAALQVDSASLKRVPLKFGTRHIAIVGVAGLVAVLVGVAVLVAVLVGVLVLVLVGVLVDVAVGVAVGGMSLSAMSEVQGRTRPTASDCEATRKSPLPEVLEIDPLKPASIQRVWAVLKRQPIRSGTVHSTRGVLVGVEVAVRVGVLVRVLAAVAVRVDAVVELGAGAVVGTGGEVGAPPLPPPPPPPPPDVVAVGAGEDWPPPPPPPPPLPPPGFWATGLRLRALSST